MSVGNWLSDNVLVSVCSMAGGFASALLAARVKRAISRDETLIRGYDQFTARLVARVEALEQEQERRDVRFGEIDTRLRKCETDRAALRVRIEVLGRQLGIST